MLPVICLLSLRIFANSSLSAQQGADVVVPLLLGGSQPEGLTCSCKKGKFSTLLTGYFHYSSGNE